MELPQRITPAILAAEARRFARQKRTLPPRAQLYVCQIELPAHHVPRGGSDRLPCDLRLLAPPPHGGMWSAHFLAPAGYIEMHCAGIAAEGPEDALWEVLQRMTQAAMAANMLDLNGAY